MTSARWFTAILLLLGCLPSTVAGQAAVPINQLGVDIVTLATGQQLRGIVYSRQKAGGLLLAVDRSWLKETLPELYQQHLEKEKLRGEKIRQELLPRLDAWILRRQGSERLLLYLEQQRTRLSMPIEADGRPGSEPGFIFVELAREEIRRSYLQPGKRKQVAMVAWQMQLVDVSSRSVSSLAQELKEQKIVDIASQRVDLSFQLPSLPDDDRQWAVRVAITEYLFDLQVSFQGTTAVLVRSDEKAAEPRPGQIIADMISAQFNRQLADLVPRGGAVARVGWQEKVIQAAEQEKVNSARVLLLHQDLRAGRVTVESHFLARMPTGKWETIALHRHTVPVGGAQPELQARIEADPQVKQVLDILATIGLGKNDPGIQRALRFGVATEIALQQVDKALGEAQLPFGQQLERPPLSAYAE